MLMGIWLVTSINFMRRGFNREDVMVAFFGLIATGIFWIAYSACRVCHKSAPPIKDMDKFAKDTIGMSPEKIKKGLKNGRW